VPGVGREGEEQGLVGGEMIEDRRQESGLSGRRPQIIQADARQSQETIEPRWISGQKG
jgi:hypothetical protein